jgi:serine/threonine-protein kinase RsbW
MSGHDDTLALELPARPDSVRRARHAAVRLARDAGAPRSSVATAVSEAVANAVLHAYRDDSGRIAFRGRVESGRLVFEVADRGVGMRPDPASAGLGIGMSLIGMAADDVRIDAGPDGTTIEMSFATGQI